jgi:hypothetical protein
MEKVSGMMFILKIQDLDVALTRARTLELNAIEIGPSSFYLCAVAGGRKLITGLAAPEMAKSWYS